MHSIDEAQKWKQEEVRRIETQNLPKDTIGQIKTEGSKQDMQSTKHNPQQTPNDIDES